MGYLHTDLRGGGGELDLHRDGRGRLGAGVVGGEDEVVCDAQAAPQLVHVVAAVDKPAVSAVRRQEGRVAAPQLVHVSAVRRQEGL